MDLTTLIPTDVMHYVTAAISIASILAAFLPKGTDGSVWFYIRKVIDVLAQNYGNAKNA